MTISSIIRASPLPLFPLLFVGSWETALPLNIVGGEGGGVRVRTLAADIGLARAGETAFVLHADMGAVIPPSQGCPCEITQGGTPRSLPRPRSAPLLSSQPRTHHPDAQSQGARPHPSFTHSSHTVYITKVLISSTVYGFCRPNFSCWDIPLRV